MSASARAVPVLRRDGGEIAAWRNGERERLRATSAKKRYDNSMEKAKEIPRTWKQKRKL